MSHSHRPCFAWIMLAALLLSAGWTSAQEPPKPLPEHDLYRGDVGKWDATMQFWATPEAEPMTMKGSETSELLGDGMWLVSRFESNFGGFPFKGLGTLGYDPAEKKYVGTWIDSVSPYLTVSKGDYDPATKTMTMLADARDGATGKQVKQKQIARYVDKNTHTFVIEQQGDDGKFWKMLEIEYKRAAD